MRRMVPNTPSLFTNCCTPIRQDTSFLLSCVVSTIICRKDIPREDIIIAIGHENTQMLDKIYAHLTTKDKAPKVTGTFKKELSDNIFVIGEQSELPQRELIDQERDIFNYVFASNLLLKLSKLRNKGIDIIKLSNIEKVVWQSQPFVLLKRSPPLTLILSMTSILFSDFTLENVSNKV